MPIRAKFQAMSVNEIPGRDDIRQVTMRAVSKDGEGNESWSKWTPNGLLQMSITNPEAFNQIEPGKAYFIDITLAGD